MPTQLATLPGKKKNKKKQAMDNSPKDGSQIDTDNVIAVTLDDLSEEGGGRLNGSLRKRGWRVYRES